MPLYMDRNHIVIVNLRFLERPQKRSRRNHLIHRRLTKTKSIGSGQDPESHAGRQLDGYGGWCLELRRGGRYGDDDESRTAAHCHTATLTLVFIDSEGNAPSTRGSRHSAKGDQFNMFPSILRLFLRWRGPNPIAKMDGEPWPDLPPGSATDPISIPFHSSPT